MKIFKYFAFTAWVIFFLSCGREDIIPAQDDPAPFTRNAFEFDLVAGVMMPDTNVAASILGRTEDKLIFPSTTSAFNNIEVGDVIYIPSAIDTFHLTKMAFKVTDKKIENGQLEISYDEPELKDVYEYFYLEVNNLTDIQFRDTVADWTPLSQTLIDELKILNLDLINLEFPAGPMRTVTFKIGNLNAKLDFQYRFQTEYTGANNALLNLELGFKDIKIKDFAFTSELELKRNNMPAPNDVGVTLAGTSFPEVNIKRFPTNILIAYGIPLTLNFDFGHNFEVGFAGKVAMEMNFGDFTFTGDPLVIRYDFLTLEDIAWTAFGTATGNAAINAVTSQFDNIQVVSNPNSFSHTNSTCPVKITTELSGFAKPSVGFGVSLSPPAFSNLGLGIYMDIFGEAVGKVSTDICLSNTGATFTPGTCFEINWGLKLPYIMGTSKSTSSSLSYNAFRVNILGEAKNNIYKFPQDCNPYDSIGLITPGIVVSGSCTGDRPFVYVNVVPPELITGSTFKLFLNGEVLPDLAYDNLMTLYFDEHDFGNPTLPGSLPYIIRDTETDALLGIGSVDVSSCMTTGCTTIMDPNEHLPTYGDRFYCAFTPDLPNYPFEWIKENMYYTKDNIGFEDFTHGRCYNSDEDNCETFGRFYTWDAANGPRRNVSPTWPFEDDICPMGYHVPSKAEWEELIQAAGGSFGYVSLVDEGWPGIYDQDRNLSGFSAFPYGFYLPGSNGGGASFQGFSEVAAFWTSTESEAANGDQFAYAVYISTENGIEIKPTIKKMGLNCRCIAD